jgi:hypothetical protein
MGVFRLFRPGRQTESALIVILIGVGLAVMSGVAISGSQHKGLVLAEKVAAAAIVAAAVRWLAVTFEENRKVVDLYTPTRRAGKARSAAGSDCRYVTSAAKSASLRWLYASDGMIARLRPVLSNAMTNRVIPIAHGVLGPNATLTASEVGRGHAQEDRGRRKGPFTQPRIVTRLARP